MEWITHLVVLGIGVFIGWWIKPDKGSVDSEAIKNATQKLDKGSKELQETIDKNKF